MLLLAVIQLSCKKKANTGTGYSVKPPKGLDTLVAMTSKVNTGSWTGDSVSAVKSISRVDSTKVDLIVTGTAGKNSSASTITFTITNYTGPNTYNIDPPYTSATYYQGTVRHYASSGQVIVSSDDPYGVIGTFSFTADSFAVTDGNFNAAQP